MILVGEDDDIETQHEVTVWWFFGWHLIIGCATLLAAAAFEGNVEFGERAAVLVVDVDDVVDDIENITFTFY